MSVCRFYSTGIEGKKVESFGDISYLKCFKVSLWGTEQKKHSASLKATC